MDARMKDIRKLKVRALRGDRAAQVALSQYTDKIAKEVNKRLYTLERRGYDFYAYNTPIHFTETMYDADRFKMSKDMEDDYYLMAQQSEIGIKFLNMNTSTLQGQKEVEQSRFDTFVDLGIIEEDYSRTKFRNFLRFIGNEESEKVLESWSESSKMVEILFDAYNRKKNTKQRMLSLFRDYLDRTVSYDIMDLMNDLGADWNAYKAKWRREGRG